MGTVAFTPNSARHPQHIGTLLEAQGNITMSNSYATGGDTLQASALGMSAIMDGVIGESGLNEYQLIPQNPPSTAKIKAIVGTTGAEVANATDLSGVTNLTAIIHGR